MLPAAQLPVSMSGLLPSYASSGLLAERAAIDKQASPLPEVANTRLLSNEGIEPLNLSDCYGLVEHYFLHREVVLPAGEARGRAGIRIKDMTWKVVSAYDGVSVEVLVPTAHILTILSGWFAGLPTR